jgi:hypothetical protein
MLCVPGLHDELVLLAVAAAAPRGIVADELVVLVIDVRPGLFGAAKPAAQADGFVVLGPVMERIVCCVHAHKAAAAPKVLHELLLGFLGPAVAVVIAHHNIVVGELWSEAAHILPRCRSGGDVGDKPVRLLHDLHEDGRGLLPLMVVLAVDEKHAQLVGGGCRRAT